MLYGLSILPIFVYLGIIILLDSFSLVKVSRLLLTIGCGANFNLVGAALNQNKSQISYWDKIGNILSNEQLALARRDTSEPMFSQLFYASILGLKDTHLISLMNQNTLGMVDQYTMLIMADGSLEMSTSNSDALNVRLLNGEALKIGLVNNLGLSNTIGSEANLASMISNSNILGVALAECPAL